MEIKSNPENLAYRNGREVLAEKGTGFVLLCQQNGYFNRKTIEELLQFSSENFGEVVVSVPNFIHNYLAIGHSFRDAKAKNDKYTNRLKNHTDRSIKKDDLSNVKFIEWNELMYESNREVLELYNLYDNNEGFRRQAIELSSDVLRIEEDELYEEGSKEKEVAQDRAARYLVEELGVFSGVPKNFSENGRACFVYHKEFPIATDFIEGRYTGNPRYDLGQLIVA